jgi:hypothetical protein
MKIRHSKTLIISNAALGDTTFDSDRGSWNITRALRDCIAGKHPLLAFDIDKVVAASINVTCDEAKIAAMVANPDRLSESLPVIFIEDGCSDDGQGIAWLIDGHHRVRAIQRLGYKECSGFLIKEALVPIYQILFNGERVAPWHK